MVFQYHSHISFTIAFDMISKNTLNSIQWIRFIKEEMPINHRFRHQVGSNIKTDYLHMKRHCLQNKSPIEWSIVFLDLWKYFGFILSVFYISFVTMMWFLSFGRLWFGRPYFEDKQVCGIIFLEAKSSPIRRVIKQKWED